jgi:hypothetical protein
MTGVRRTEAQANTVWIAPSATRFSCLCERCLDDARGAGSSFVDAVRKANVRGALALETDVGFARCDAGHELVVRRVDRPPALSRRDVRQLELA